VAGRGRQSAEAADSEAMVSMETVEINPIDEHNRTVTLGVELASLLSARKSYSFPTASVRLPSQIHVFCG
jgi:hypothetical protein